MSVTRVNSRLILDGTVNRDDIDTTTTGKALITKVLAGANVSITQTGVDNGTGDVTVNVSGSITFNTGTAGTDFNITPSPVSLGGITTFNIPDAASGVRGLITASSQSIQGLKAFTSGLLVNTVNNIFRSTNSGANIASLAFVDIDNSTSVAGSQGVTFDTTYGLGFTVANGTRRILRGSLKITNANNTANSESGDLSFYTQNVGAAVGERFRIGKDGKIYLLTNVSAYTPNASGISSLALNKTTGEFQEYNYDKKSFGDLYNKTSWTSLTDFAVNTAGATVVSNLLNIPNGAVGDFSKSLSINGFYNSNHWKFVAEIKFTSLNTNGISIGTGSVTTTSGSNCDVALYVSNITSTRGQLQLFERHNSATTTWNSVLTSSTNLTIATNDVVRLTIERANGIIYCTAENITTNTSAVIMSYTYPTSGGAIPPNVQRFTVYSHSGTYTISKLQTIEREQQNSLIVCVGDSKTLGYGATAWNKTWAYQIGKYYHSVSICAGFGERIADVTSRISEILNLNPQYIILSIGSNDKRAGVADATTFTAYQALVTALSANGAQIIHLNGWYESAQDNSSLMASVLSTYGANVVNTSNITKKNGLYSDGIHLNDNSNLITFHYIQDSNLLPGYDRFTEYF